MQPLHKENLQIGSASSFPTERCNARGEPSRWDYNATPPYGVNWVASVGEGLAPPAPSRYGYGVEPRLSIKEAVRMPSPAGEGGAAKP